MYILRSPYTGGQARANRPPRPGTGRVPLLRSLRQLTRGPAAGPPCRAARPVWGSRRGSSSLPPSARGKPAASRARPVRLGLSSPIGGVVSAIIDVLMYAQAVFSPSEVFAVYPFAHPPFFISHHVTVLGPAPNSTALWEKCIPWGSQKSARHTLS